MAKVALESDAEGIEVVKAIFGSMIDERRCIVCLDLIEQVPWEKARALVVD